MFVVSIVVIATLLDIIIGINIVVVMIFVASFFTMSTAILYGFPIE